MTMTYGAIMVTVMTAIVVAIIMAIIMVCALKIEGFMVVKNSGFMNFSS